MTITSTFTFTGMDNVRDPASVGAPDRASPSYSKCVDIVNCDVTNESNVSRRQGFAFTASAAITSSWGNGTEAYCVAGGLLYSFDGTDLHLVAGAPTLLPTTEFCQVNNIVAFSDGTTIGYIEAGVPHVIATAGEAAALTDLAAWVKSHYPAGAGETQSNMEVDAFKVTTMAGRCLEFFNGALYLSVNNFIFCTRTFNIEKMDLRFNTVAGFRGDVTMIRGVNDGLYVGTTEGSYFLAGEGVKGVAEGVRGFAQIDLTPFGVYYGSGIKVAGDKIPAISTEKKAVIWMTSDGVHAGGDGGRFVDLTKHQVYMPAVSTIAPAIRRAGEAWQYLAAAPETTIVINLANGAHSRFTDYDFTGFFTHQGHDYGTNAAGVFRLSGETDNSAAIDASFTTPLVDFGAPVIKRCTDAYLHVRTGGTMSLGLLVDETEIATDLPFAGPDKTGARRLRAKLPRGTKGTNWQFRVTNTDGCAFTAFSLKTDPVISKRSI